MIESLDIMFKDELYILRKLIEDFYRDGFRYMVRNENGELFVSDVEPRKSTSWGEWHVASPGEDYRTIDIPDYIERALFGGIPVLWTDNKPTSIYDMIQRINILLKNKSYV